jgi:2,3-dihydroxy-p-cumate/2,3-dihydroxybenzoate 3,4-dioxygenase
MPVNFRYKKLGYIALNVTDLARTLEFATRTFALEHTFTGPSGEIFLSCGPEHHDVVLYQNKEPGFVRSGHELETPDDVERAYAHYAQLGVKPVWLAKEEKEVLGLDPFPAFRMREPTAGVCFEYYSKMIFRARPRVNLLTNFIVLGHFGVNVPSVKESTLWAEKNMGFMCSDILGDYIGTLMRAFPNPNHHTMGYLPARDGKKQFNHMAFMVEAIDDIGKLFNRIEAHGVRRGFGIGKHPTSGSIHLYIFDPDSLVWEYTLGMEQFPEVGYREPRLMSAAPEDYDVWGAVPKPGFGGSGTVVTHDAPVMKIA